MNAYELAEIITVHDGSRVWEHGLEIATMLRQQADRIAELEKQGSSIWDSTRRVYKNCQCDSCKNKTLPQTKPLSNDEILEMTIWNKNLYELYVEMEKEDMIAFARAIEERHGIK